MPINRNGQVSKAVKLALMAGSLPLVATQAAFAQEMEGAAELEEITVTGSRIPARNLISASPVTTVGNEEIAFQGVTRIEDMLNRLPQVYASQGGNQANGATNTATVDLRGLGPQRTLVLMNGRRLPPGSPVGGTGSLAADVNQIPSALIERVEVLTGGASATYGSDAVAGVVNFITKSDFEGFALDFQYSLYQTANDDSVVLDLSRDNDFDVPEQDINDGFTTDISIMIGANTADGAGNVTMYAGYREIDAVISGKRDWANCALGGAADEWSCGGSTTLPQGRFTDFGLVDPSFDFIVEGTEFVDRQGELYNFQPPNFIQRPDERFTVGAIGHYRFNDAFEVYAEISYMDDVSDAQIAPSGAFFVTSTLPCGNPLLSVQQFQRLCGDYGLTVDDAQSVYIGRRNVEGGFRTNLTTHVSSRIVVGARGDIDEAWSYDVHLNTGQVKLAQTYLNDLSTERIIRALNVVADPVTGDPVCQSVLDGSDQNCIPWNVFETGGVLPDGQDPVQGYIAKSLFATGEVSTDIVSGYLTGDMGQYGVSLPTADTGIQLVLGYEYRQEKIAYQPDDGFQRGDGAGQGGATLPANGSIAVKEYFFEGQIPLFEGYDFAQSVNLNLGYRYSDYGTPSGEVVGGLPIETDPKTTDTYKASFDWSFNDQIRLRASLQRAVRAGNLRDLFQPFGLNLFDMPEDPCGPSQLATLEQCVNNTGLPAGQYGNAALDNDAGQYNFLQGGNPNVTPEESDTLSVGGIWSPIFIDGLTISVDWFSIEVEDAISIIPQRFTLDQCLATGDAIWCDNVVRAPNTGSLWAGTRGFIRAPNVNIGYFEREGIDLQIGYTTPIGDMGDLDFSLVGTALLTADTQPSPTSDVVDCKGSWENGQCVGAFPEWAHTFRTTWATPWDLDLSLLWRYTSAVDDRGGRGADWDAYNWIDLAATWQVTDSTQLRLGINNVMDEDPPLSADVGTYPGNANTFPGFYDPLGRYIFMGIALKL
jgi:iron complex outermembrane receptor protein